MDLHYFMDLKRGNPMALVNWLQRRSLIPNPLHCGNCNLDMTLVNRSVTHVDSLQWRCRGCRKKRSLRTNSFFSEFPKTSLGNLLLVIYFWAEDDPQKKTAKKLSLNKNLVNKIYRRLEDVCSVDIDRRPFIPFGGCTYITMCDESKFNHKAKYHRGRRPRENSWVFGIVTTEFTPARGYFQVVRRRNRASLLPIIQRCLLPNSEIHTDDWGAYHGMDQILANVSRHRVVVHARNFVDPNTGVHTQNIESAWSTLKQGIKRRKGIRPCDLQAFLDERMWRQWRGFANVVQNFIHVLSLQFINVPV